MKGGAHVTEPSCNCPYVLSHDFIDQLTSTTQSVMYSTKFLNDIHNVPTRVCLLPTSQEPNNFFLMVYNGKNCMWNFVWNITCHVVLVLVGGIVHRAVECKCRVE